MPSTASGRYLPPGYAATYPNDPGKQVFVADGADLRNVDIGLPSSLAIEGRVWTRWASRCHAWRCSPADTCRVATSRSGLADFDSDRRSRALSSLRSRAWQLLGGGRRSKQRVLLRAVVQLLPVLSGLCGATGPRTVCPYFPSLDPRRIQSAACPCDRPGRERHRHRPAALEATDGRRDDPDSRGEPAASTPAALMRRGLALFDTRPLQTDGLGRFRATIPSAREVSPAGRSGLASGLGSVNGRTEFAEVQLSIATDTSDLVVVTQPGIGLAGQFVFAEAPPANAPPMKIALRRPEGRLSGTEGLDTTDGQRVAVLCQRRVRPVLIRVSGLPTGWAVKAVSSAVRISRTSRRRSRPTTRTGSTSCSRRGSRHWTVTCAARVLWPRAVRLFTCSRRIAVRGGCRRRARDTSTLARTGSFASAISRRGR